jgi:glucose-1-phosphate adenylyltransferase
VFTAQALIDAVTRDADTPGSRHDMGGDIITAMVERGEARVHDFVRDNHVPGETERDHGYWRDVGTIDAYYDAHMDLVSVHPVFNLYNDRWPIYAWNPPLPPAKFVFDLDDRRGSATDSMVCAGVIVSGGTVRRSVLAPGAHVHSRALVEGSVLLHGVDVGRDAVVRRAVIDKNVRVPPGVRIGVDEAADRAAFHVSAGGIVVIGKNDVIPPAHGVGA